MKLLLTSAGTLIRVCFIIFAFVAPAAAAVDPATGPMFMGKVANSAERWQRIDFRSAQLPLRTASQIKIAIQTKGPRMTGLIRIPGAPASNFDTGAGMTVVDLINVGNKVRGFAEIVALEILFTESMPDQSFWILTVDYVDGMK